MNGMTDDLTLARELYALPGAVQAARLDALGAQDAERAGRVRALLAQMGHATAYDAVAAAQQNVDLPQQRGGDPRFIGPYKVIARIGEGGMGAVYLAEQTAPTRRVAIKVMRADWQSPEAHARFDREADVLARLEHPNIAGLYASGVAELGGMHTPYLAMEYVEGIPLSEYVRGHALAPRAIIALLVVIADAVQHAHLRGVVHRDLKPGNILVDAQGRPHILDFGIAHLTEGDGAPVHHLTRTGQMIGTVQYMSPEQFIGDPRLIDGRTDVYALGVIAFELLTGELPHRLADSSLLDAARIVTRQVARTMSSVRRELRGDLELIVAKALAQDLSQRYPSAADFAADLRRFEGHEPILARAPSWSYRAQRYARRHWLPLSAGALVLLSLSGGLIASWRSALRESQARALAEQRADEALAVSQFLSRMLNAAKPDEAQGKEVSVRAVIDKAVADESLRPDNPVVRAKVDQLLGSLLIELGDPQAALPLLDAATTRLAQTPGEAPRELLTAQSERAIALGLLGRSAESLRDARSVYEQAQRLQPADPELVEDAAYSLSLALYNEDDLVAAEQVIIQSERPIASDAGSEAARQIDLRNTLGRIYNASGRHAQALAVRKDIMDWYLRVHGPRNMKTLSVQSNYAVSLSQMDRNAEAVELLRRTLPIRLELLGAEHVDFGVHEVNLATSLRLLERHAEALPLFEDGYRIFRAKLGADSPRTLLADGYVGDALTHTDAVDAGLRRMAAVLAAYQRIDQGNSRWAVMARNDYAAALVRAGRLDTAAKEYALIDQDRARYADNRSMQAELDYARGLYFLARTDAAQAQPLLQSALANQSPPAGRGAVATRIAAQLMRAERALGRDDRADQLARDYGLSAEGAAGTHAPGRR